MSRLVLIDGSSYLYRAYHALPALTAPDGTPTGALTGVVNMVRALLRERPEHIAFVLDAPGPTFRDELFPDYKAQRPPMPDDLRAQVEPMIALVEALGVPLLRIAGVEADDVIGTLAVAGAGVGMDVLISTSDKDFAQLVRPGITLANTMSGSLLDRAGVIDKFGVPPERVVDLLALWGDSVDNIPGVEKCGPKTAAKWLAEYGDLDGVIAHADAVTGKVGENLRAALDRLPLNRELVTIRTDVELPLTPEQLACREPDRETLRSLYVRLGFQSALRDLDQTGSAPPPPDPALAQSGDYRCILDPDALDDLVQRLTRAELIAFDTETDALDPMRANLVGISFATEPGRADYIPLGHRYPGAPAQLPHDRVLEALRPVLESADHAKLGQHGKYDLHILRRHGIAVAGYAEDTLLESFVLDAGANGSRHDMDSLAQRHLGYQTITYEQVTGKGSKQISFAEVELDRATAYAAEDADITLRLHRVLAPRLAAEPGLDRVYRTIEMPLVPVLARMEATGVLVDAQALRRQSIELGTRMEDIRRQAFDAAGGPFNLDSPKQLQTILFERLGLDAVVKTPKGAPSTNEEALAAIAGDHLLPQLILDYRSLAKLRSTYTEKLPDAINPETGRVHTSYHQAGAATGRLASSDPNLQNIPIRTEEGRRIRTAFIAPPGRTIVACDYSQIELRIMAHLSGDRGLIDAFEAGRDIHRATAAEVFGIPLDTVSGEQRRAAKAINFGLIYGMSAFGLARQLGIPRGEAQDYIALYFARYPGVRDYMERTRHQARDTGYVETVFGRRLYLPEIRSRNQAARAGAERAAINAPMQGTAADIIKRAMVTIDAWLAERRVQAAMIMQVHDELVFEVDTDAVQPLIEAVTARMRAAAELRVTLEVDTGFGNTWGEAH